jgi:predicted KAP-like P-loop ATPase
MPFAKWIAGSISTRRDPKSIVLGVYGAWGDGKSTVINFIEKELKESTDVICIRFNPWNFSDSGHLIRNFFNTLTNALNKSISTKKEKIKRLLQDYASILSPESLSLGSLSKLSPAESDNKKGSLSSLDLDEVRNQIDQLLIDEKKRVVILMDDVDRLDKNGLQTIFKLVKLTADFENTTYVLAFDDTIVSEAFEDKYPSRHKESGQRFLEKLVQVPLHLPTADKMSLRQLCFKSAKEVLKEYKIKMTDEQVQTFVKHFKDGVEVRLKNPRMVNRYKNALSFSLPILKDEVNPVDLMLIEGIRVFYPKLYEVVRDNPDLFLDPKYDTFDQDDKTSRFFTRKIDKGLEEFTYEESEAAKELLKVLFPRLNDVLGGTMHNPEREVIWAKEQRISSREYFDRFFSFSVPEGDISDHELDSLLIRAEKESIEKIIEQIRKLVSNRGIEKFIEKLRRKEKILSPKISYKLALAISNGEFIVTKPKRISSFSKIFSQAGMFVSQLVHNIPNGDDRFKVAKSIIQNGTPISFALECFRCFRATDRTIEKDMIFSVNEQKLLGKIIVERIREISQEKPIYIQSPKDTPYFLFVWSHWGSRDETDRYLKKMVNEEPNNSIELLKCYLPKTSDEESLIPQKDDFGREQYNSITKVVDTDAIYNSLYKIYGSELDTPKYGGENDRTLNERVAHQFAFIHQQVKKG